MIKTVLDKEAAQKVVDMGRVFHAESHFRDQPYDGDRIWALLEATIKFPEKYFIAFDENLHGFIIMNIQQHYFSGHKWASDFCLYVLPEHRNGLLAPKLIKAAEVWSKENGAREMTIFHNTGINTGKATSFFNKFGYETKGYIFTKELK
jgi:GNAT superfamily N-acetyltransferase